MYDDIPPAMTAKMDQEYQAFSNAIDSTIAAVRTNLRPAAEHDSVARAMVFSRMINNSLEAGMMSQASLITLCAIAHVRLMDAEAAK